jgi:hypothetical protein
VEALGALLGETGVGRSEAGSLNKAVESEGATSAAHRPENIEMMREKMRIVEEVTRKGEITQSNERAKSTPKTRSSTPALSSPIAHSASSKVEVVAKKIILQQFERVFIRPKGKNSSRRV